MHVAPAAPAPDGSATTTTAGSARASGAGGEHTSPVARGVMGDSGVISSEDLPEIERIIANITQQRQPFERVEVTKDEALEMFRYNPFKCAIIHVDIVNLLNNRGIITSTC